MLCQVPHEFIPIEVVSSNEPIIELVENIPIQVEVKEPVADKIEIREPYLNTPNLNSDGDDILWIY